MAAVKGWIFLKPKVPARGKITLIEFQRQVDEERLTELYPQKVKPVRNQPETHCINFALYRSKYLLAT